MADRDPNPVSAFFLGISTTLGRFVVLWFILAVFLGIPFFPRFGWEAMKNLLFWPVAFVGGVVFWSGGHLTYTMGAILLPVGIIVAAWGYVTDHAPALSLWLVATLSLVLTGPFLFIDEVSRWIPFGIGVAWCLVSFGWYRISGGFRNDS